MNNHYRGRHTFRARCGAALIAAALSLGGCTRPSNTSITNFSDTTKTLAASVQKSAEFNINLGNKLAIAEGARIYGDKGNVSIPDSAKLLGGYGAPSWKSLTGFIDSVSEYAEALRKLNDPTLVTNVSGGVAAVGNAAAAAASKVGAPEAAAFGAISNICAQLIQLALEARTASQIKDLMLRAQTQLDAAEKPLKTIIGILQRDNDILVSTAGSSVRDQLEQSKNIPDPTVSGTEFQRRYIIYTSLVEEYRKLRIQNQALKSLPSAISDMVDAHRAVLKSLDDPSAANAALVAFTKSVGEIAVQVGTLKTANQE